MWTLWVASDPANCDLHRVEAAARNLGGSDDGSMGPGFAMMNTANLGHRNVTNDQWIVASGMMQAQLD